MHNMDLRTVFQCLIDQMDPEDLLQTANEVFSEILGPQPPSATPAVKVEFDTTAQPVEDLNEGYDSYLPLEAAPLDFELPLTAAATLSVEQPAPSNYCLSAVSDDLYNQGQFLPYQWPQYDASTASIRALPHLNLPMETPQGLEQNLEPNVLLGMVYGNPAVTSFPPVEPPSPQFTCLPPQKREYKCQHGPKNKHPYVKKPPNAFMLFLKDQRPNVARDLGCRDNALVNKVLGQSWKAMSNRQQAKYFKEAERLRKLHAEKYPWWSPRENYGQKRKRIRRRRPTMSNDDEDWEP